MPEQKGRTARDAGMALANAPAKKKKSDYEYEDHPWDDPVLQAPDVKPAKPTPTPKPAVQPSDEAMAKAEELEKRRKKAGTLFSWLSDMIPGQK